MNNEKLEHLFSKLTENGIAGINVSTLSNGEARHYAFGEADTATHERMKANNYEHIASITKLFTAVTIMRFVERDLVSLDSEASSYLPESISKHLNFPYTVRELLNHTTGLTEPELALFPSIRQGSLDSVEEFRERNISPEDLTLLGLEQPSPLKPGEMYFYSNTNYHLLGLIIENISGKNAYDAIADETIVPAGLNNTFFPGGAKTLPNPSSKAYDSLYQLVSPAGEFSRYDMSCVYTAGALISRPEDLNHFVAYLLSGKLLSSDTMNKMLSSLVEVDEGVKAGFGLQIVEEDSQTLVGTEGVFFGTHTTTLAREDGMAAWTIALNTTKYQSLGDDGWPNKHPADEALQKLGKYLTSVILN